MSKGEKRLARMRNNPAGDWQMADVAVICAAFGIQLEPPTSGSHWSVFHSGAGILTIPARRPIKGRYIREFVRLVDQVAGTAP